jgi:AraC-like DNA-binding protein
MIDFLDIVFVYHLKSPDDLRWHSRIHSHSNNQYELHYFIQGEGSFQAKDRFSIRPGQMFISLPEEVHRVDVKSLDVPLIYYAVLFSPRDSAADLSQLLTGLAMRNPLSLGKHHRFFFEELREKAQSKDSMQRKSAEHQFLSLLYQAAAENSAFHFGDDRNRHIERALGIMQENIFKRLTMEEVAFKLNLSDSYFIRLFKDKMNMTPKRYFTRLKVEAAASMLSGSELPVHRIAERLGFSSEFHLSRVIKQITGFSPREYRKGIHHQRERSRIRE